MKRFLVFSLLFAAFASPARGEGALAIGIPEEGLRAGFAYGWALQRSTAREAEQRALEICREQAEKYGVPASRCKIIETFAKKCVAVALDVNDFSAGWAVGETKQDADNRALRQCAENGRTCKIHNSDCD
jgi:hypothetical protein